MVELRESAEGLSLFYNGREVLRHSAGRPCLYAGRASLDYKLFKGKFHIRDRSRLSPLRQLDAERSETELSLRFSDGERSISLVAREADGLLCLAVQGAEAGIALRLELCAVPGERIYGCGEHFTRLNLRGQKVRIWVEEHIGTIDAVLKVLSLAIGIKPRTKAFSRYSSYHPQPSFVSSAMYFCHAEADAHAIFDFSKKDRHRLLFHSPPRELIIGSGEGYPALIERLSALLGRQPPLPSWMHDGMILGIQDGSDVCEAKADTLRKAGAAICGIWAQDWEGQRLTYFGKQLRWDYRWDKGLYAGLPERIRAWRGQGLSFMGYINPYLCEDGAMFAEAAALGHLALKPDGSIYLTKATSFPFGIVDLTKSEAFDWYKGIIKTELIGIGMMGWMADFGEYLPADAVLQGGLGAEWHNRWPVLWARLNREAIEEAGLLGQACFFTRSGYSRSSAYTTLAWNGDQHVDWSDDYGIGSVVRASLSLAMSGMALCHSDVGGYTTLPRMARSKELFLRWLELGAFSPVMRSHEGNRPDANWQFDSDQDTIRAVARFSRIHAALKPYLEAMGKEAAERGMPLMRPLFFHYDGDFGADEDKAYLLGRDLAVYPVLKKGATRRRLSLPDDRWIGLWDGKAYGKGVHELAAPLGCIPAFYRASSGYAKLFASLAGL
ncbi:MAG TPA: alpha-glucosidase [Spirochaetaceae bacterium]|jgi:alpha-glucosidase|nr:alpha-glucosidase [Spirochaetaceae bacterium]